MPDAPVSSDLIAAMSRAAALPLHHLVAWPPARVAMLDREAVVRELRQLRDLDRGSDIAVVAMAELGDEAGPALRGELAEHARNEFTALAFAPGTIGDALQRRALDGLSAGDDARGLRVDWLAPHLSRGQGDVHIGLRLTGAAAAQRGRGQTRLPSGLALARRLAPEWRARAEEVLRTALAGEDLSAEAVADSLLQALLPDTLGGRADWLLTRGLELLGAGEATPIAEAIRGDRAHAIHLLSVKHERWAGSYGQLRLLVRATTREQDHLVDVFERETWAHPLAPGDHEAPPPADEAVARAAVAAWQAAVQQYFARADVQVDARMLIEDFLPLARPLDLLATWTREGPPGPPPVPPPPRAVLADDRLTAAAARARLLDTDETEALRASVDGQVLAAIELDGWTVLFCPCHRPAPGTFEEDRILLCPPGGTFMAILMSDPWNGHVMPIDGDAALFRVVARFWREILDRAGLDVAFVHARDAEDDEEDDEEDDDEQDEDDDEQEEDQDHARTSLRAWLELPLPDSGLPSFPLIDWRVYEDDADRDFIAAFSFWASGPFAMPPERRAVFEAAIASHYHAYIRAVIDPAFPRA